MKIVGYVISKNYKNALKEARKRYSRHTITKLKLNKDQPDQRKNLFHYIVYGHKKK